MADDRKRKDDSNWAAGLAGLGIGVAIVAAGVGLGYKLWNDHKKKQEDSMLETSAGERRAISYENDGSDEDDDFYPRFEACRAFTKQVDINDIGINFNDWRIPKSLTASELNIATQFCDAANGELNIPNEDWTKATRAVNKVLDLLNVEIRKEAEKYEGLVIEKYVKQGSSREGLKVHAADEFDVLLQFHFDNLEYKVENIRSDGRILPELAYLRVDSTMERLLRTHPKLYNKGVFAEMDGEPYLNTRNLQEKVFKSLIASAASSVERKVNDGEYKDQFEFKIKLRTNPPSVNIVIVLTDGDDYCSTLKRLEELRLESKTRGNVVAQGPNSAQPRKETDVDIVPALMLFENRVPDPSERGCVITCPTYAVFKWLTENHKSASRYGASPSLLWRICSSGYEKHVMDVAQGKIQQLYIVKALRVFKLYFRNMKKGAIEQGNPPPQVVTVLRSYHLKHIALYCILFLRVLNRVQVLDLKVALAYMMAFLEVCLEERKLPHFFHANEHISTMFPEYRCDSRSYRYDLLQGKDPESFNQAMRSFKSMQAKLSKIIWEQSSSSIFVDALVSHEVVTEFKNFVSSGIYFHAAKEIEKKSNKLAIGLGIGAGIVGVGLLAGLGYVLWKDHKETKKAETRMIESHESGASKLDTGDMCAFPKRNNVLPSRTALAICGPERFKPNRTSSDIGVNCNEWKIPKRLTVSEIDIATCFCEASEAQINLSNPDWTKATEVVSKVLDMLMLEIQCEAKKYSGLCIEKYVKQGSSREGLKVHAPDEFDVLLQFHFENLDYKVMLITLDDKVLPELAYLHVDSTMELLSQTHTRLYNRGVFIEMDGEPYLNTRNLQEKVFTSLIASAASSVEREINDGEYRAMLEFKIKIRTNPPSVNIGIEFTCVNEGIAEDVHSERSLIGSSVQTKRIIDVDVVPGLQLEEDRVPDPTRQGYVMACPSYAVFKWFTENHRSPSRYGASPSLLWRICSSGYEKHVMDVAQGKIQQLYIVKALRVFKLYFRNMKKGAIEQGNPPPQVVTVLRSYHLKHIALYCILFLRVLNRVQVLDIKVALAYMMAFLEVCLEERKLPHFFHANEHITMMFPEFSCNSEAYRYDLLQGKDRESFNQAIRSFKAMQAKLSKVISDRCTASLDDFVSPSIIDQFRRYILEREYYR